MPAVPRQSLVCFSSQLATQTQKKEEKNHVRWDERETLTSPDRRWKLDVFPVFDGKDNHSPVQLTDCADGKTHTAMYLKSESDVYWGPDGNSLLIIDEQCAVCSDLLLFGDVESWLHEEKPNTHAKSRVADEIRHAVEKGVGSDMDLYHYAVKFVSWQGSGLVVSVSVDSVKKDTDGSAAGNSDKMVGHCYGAIVDTKENRLVRLVLDKELRKEYDGHCK